MYREQHFVKEHGLVSPAAVSEIIAKTEAKIILLEDERTKLDNRIRRAKTPEEKERLKLERRELSAKIAPLRKTLKTAQDVYGDIPKIEGLLRQEIEMQQQERLGRSSKSKQERKDR